MDYLENEITEFVGLIFETTLGLAISRGDSSPDPAESKNPFYIGIVQITGDWSGAVVARFEEEAAVRCTSAMLNLSPEQIEPVDIEDVLSELSNMLAGNIKALMSGSSNLALPIVVKSSDAMVSMHGSDLVTRIEFACEDSGLEVRLLQKRS